LSFYAPTSAVEIETFGLGVKVISTSPDYCNYQRDADNSSITATRIMAAFEQSMAY
jgi:heptosyltransferase II